MFTVGDGLSVALAVDVVSESPMFGMGKRCKDKKATKERVDRYLRDG
jgi:hypothetical protein